MLLFPSELLWAQDGGMGISQGGFWLFIIFMLVAIALLIGDGLVRAQARMGGVEVSRDDNSFFPGLTSLLGSKTPKYIRDGSFKKLTRGYDIKLEGEAREEIIDVEVNTFAVQPQNFRGIAPIPKMMVEVGQEVKAGEALFFNKANPDIHYVAPVSGEVIDIRRGAKRAITEVVILADKEQTYRTLPDMDIDSASRAELIEFLKASGFWPFIIQRPYDLVADPSVTPRDIFISTFDSAPLAPNMNMVVEGHGKEFQMGLSALSKLTDGDVHLGLDARGEMPAVEFTNSQGVEKHWFDGKHPVGNVGIQIHHIKPIKAGDTVWTLTVEDVILLGDIILNHRYQPQRLVAVAGNGANDQHYIKTMLGASITDLLKSQNLDTDANRIIAGDVLSGSQISAESFLGARVNQITIIPEGRNFEMFGWLLPAIDRPTISRTYPNFLFSDLKYDVDTNTHGERRAFVQTGQYESMMPADIYPQHLMKAIIINDFEKMEGLGLYELTEEDVALCEFACTSKQPLQKILREGLETMREQG